MTIPSAPVDHGTASLLDLLADDGTVSVDYEWDEYVRCLHHAADASGIVRPNTLRPLLRGVVKPQRVGAFTHRALASGLLVRTGEWQISDDTTGRNGGKPCPVMRLTGGAA